MENVIERAVILASDRDIIIKDIPDFIEKNKSIASYINVDYSDSDSFKLKNYSSGMEKKILKQKL